LRKNSRNLLWMLLNFDRNTESRSLLDYIYTWAFILSLETLIDQIGCLFKELWDQTVEYVLVGRLIFDFFYSKW
jgi:hypothetical protein